MNPRLTCWLHSWAETISREMLALQGPPVWAGCPPVLPQWLPGEGHKDMQPHHGATMNALLAGPHIPSTGSAAAAQQGLLLAHLCFCWALLPHPTALKHFIHPEELPALPLLSPHPSLALTAKSLFVTRWHSRAALLRAAVGHTGHGPSSGGSVLEGEQAPWSWPPLRIKVA